MRSMLFSIAWEINADWMGQHSPAAFAQSFETVLADDMSACHHHRWVGVGALFLADRTSKDAVVAEMIRKWNLDLQCYRCMRFSRIDSRRLYDCFDKDSPEARRLDSTRFPLAS